MDEGTTDAIRFPEASSQDVLTGILREGAQKLLAQAIEAKVHAHIEAHKELRDAAEEHGWPILEFSRQVGLTSRLTRPVPLISGATFAAGLGALAVWILVRKNRK